MVSESLEPSCCKVVCHRNHLGDENVVPWWYLRTRGPFHQGFLHRNSNSMEISFHSHLDSNSMIATKFCTWHDSYAVVACAKICCDLMASNGVMARRSFHRISIAGKKTLVKRAPVHCGRQPDSLAPGVSRDLERFHKPYLIIPIRHMS